MLTIGSVRFVCGKRLGNYILIMRLVVLVPFVTSMHAIEVSRFPRAILVFPVVRGWPSNTLFDVEELFLFIQLAFCLSAVQRFGQIRIAGGLDAFLLGGGLNSLWNESGTCDIAPLLQLHFG